MSAETDRLERLLRQLQNEVTALRRRIVRLEEAAASEPPDEPEPTPEPT